MRVSGAVAMVGRADVRPASPTTLWTALLAGPVAWLFDEGTALVIEATVCSTPRSNDVVIRAALVLLGVVALACIAVGAGVATRSLRAFDRIGTVPSIRVERSRFLAMAALLLAAVCGFGVFLRIVTAFVGGVCR